MTAGKGWELLYRGDGFSCRVCKDHHRGRVEKRQRRIRRDPWGDPDHRQWENEEQPSKKTKQKQK